MLSKAAQSVWAKSNRYGDRYDWEPLWLHLLDTAYIAEYLARHWLAPSIRDVIAREFIFSYGGDSHASQEVNDALGANDGITPTGGLMVEAEEEFVAFCSWVAGVHDIGKVSPAFSTKDRELNDAMREKGLISDPLTPHDRSSLRHGLAGEIIVKKWLMERHDARKDSARAIASVVGAHHGVPSRRGAFSEKTMSLNPLQGRGDQVAAWVRTREEILSFIEKHLHVEKRVEKWGQRSWSQPFLVLVSGLVIVADWIASCEEYFPLFRRGTLDVNLYLDPEEHRRRVEDARRKITFPSPWSPTDDGKDAHEFLRERFNFSDDVQATSAQKEAVTCAREMELPGLLIVEDATGSGKTEAALLAAEIMAARTGRSGVLFALPTQATTDAMFSRQLHWLASMTSADGKDSAGEVHRFNVQLQHGRAALNEEISRLKNKGRKEQTEYPFSDCFLGAPDIHLSFTELSGITAGQNNVFDEDDTKENIVVFPWFSGRKKSILADFVTTTVDHVLMAALCAPHLMLRHMGLARKVVVIDEVHSYSTYMNGFLETALTWLAAYNVPVILLSATLSSVTTEKLTYAYRKGLAIGAGDDLSSEKSEEGDGTHVIPYPCLVRTDRHGVKTVGVEGGRSAEIVVRLLGASVSLEGLLSDILTEGGCVLIVRNTVRRAQQTFEELRNIFGDCVSLHHSRFTVRDRLNKDEWLLRKFGHPSSKPERPLRAIVVATQVVEQSLDVDFDLLITDLAPIDLLLQRMGRLHRHRRNRPIKVCTPVCFVDAVPSPNFDPTVERGAESIYGLRDMLLSAAVVNKICCTSGKIVLPEDTRWIIESVYGQRSDDLIPDAWTMKVTEGEKVARAEVEELRRSSLAFMLGEPSKRGSRSSSLVNWLHTNAGDDRSAESRVREGEETLEVILLRKDSVGNIYPWEDGELFAPLPTDTIPTREDVRAILLSSIRLPVSFTRDRARKKDDGENEGRLGEVLKELERSSYFAAWQGSPLLRGQLFLFMENGGAEIAGRRLEYDSNIGLREVSQS